MSSQSSEVILEARSVTRRYPGTIALNAVDFRAYRNQVNVLIGENGAGKSTLMRILAGIESPDEGELLLEGEPIRIGSPREAARHGIAIVHQELAILPNLDLTENIFAGREMVKSKIFLDRPAEDRRSVEALRRLHKPMNVRRAAGHVSLGACQIVEVARTLDQNAKILILDEPTSALSSAEAESLFAVIGDLKRAGLTIIYISHRLHELLHLGDRFTVLRSGRVVGEAPRSEVTRQWIVARMSGRDLSDMTSPANDTNNAPELLRVEGITLAASSGEQMDRAPVDSVSFNLREGEILGVYGLLGAGRTEMLEALAGSRRVNAGVVRLRGEALRIACVADAVRSGIVLVPEDRQRDGLIPELNIRENIALAFSSGFFLHRRQEADAARRIANDLNIAAADLELPVTTLSGGNQQKVLIARCLMKSPSLLLLDEPTRGVDVGAKVEIYNILRKLAAQGIGVLFATSEIEEAQALADRLLVLCQGRISAELERSQFSDEVLFAAASPRIAPHPSALSGPLSV